VLIYFLIGFRNRLAVAMNWGWNYITFQRGTRLITGISGSRIEDVVPVVMTARRRWPRVSNSSTMVERP
jgi:hypothetical protein